MKTVDKAVAAVVREHGGRRELLVFRHPRAGVQLPKGTVEQDESVAAAVLRELHEESGLLLDAEPVPIGTWNRVLDGSFGETATLDLHVWHLHLLPAPPGVPDRWSHRASGSAEEDGLVFAFHWLPIDAGLRGALHPVFGEAVTMLLTHLEGPAGGTR